MRVPARILEHPVESLIAGVLLLVLLFGSADRSSTQNGVQTGVQADGTQAGGVQTAQTQKL